MAFAITTSSVTAMADPEAVGNIPTDQQKSELAPPYEAWRGHHHAPPRASAPRDLPAPLVRPREQARRPFEAGAALLAFLPSCGAGRIDDRGCDTSSPAPGIEVTLLYRPTPLFAVGGEGVGSRGARFIGAVGRLYFAEAGAWDPHLALGLGVGELSRDRAEQDLTRGLGARVAFGIDYRLASHWRVGPHAAYAHWLVWSERGLSAYGKVVGFATLGVRITGSFGDVL
jgi:hypothetical protein